MEYNRQIKMKFIRFFFLFLFWGCALSMSARNPYGCYKTKYVLFNNNGKTDASPSERTIYVSENSISVPQTSTGSKRWDVKYLGVINYAKYKNLAFHKFYFINKKVYCYISDEKVFQMNGRLYYIIEFDGQTQIADYYN